MQKKKVTVNLDRLNARNHINIPSASYSYVTHINDVKIKEKFFRSLSIILSPLGIVNSSQLSDRFSAHETLEILDDRTVEYS